MSEARPTASTTTYALLGLLDARSWTGYELTQQMRRSLHFVWPSSEGHVYREQKRLVALGWATVTSELIGKRRRRRYAITAAGRQAMREWLRTAPAEPRFEIEAIVRMFYGNQGSIEDLVRAMESTSRMADEMRASLVGFAREYVEHGGPLWMLEHARGDRNEEPPVFHGRPQFPERLHVIALVLEVMAEQLTALTSSLAAAAGDVRTWPSPTNDAVTPATRRRLERILDRYGRSPSDT